MLDAAEKALAEPKKRAQQTYRKARASLARTRNPADKAVRSRRGEAEMEVETIELALSGLTKCARILRPGLPRRRWKAVLPKHPRSQHPKGRLRASVRRRRWPRSMRRRRCCTRIAGPSTCTCLWSRRTRLA